jgi:hypothetical protein
MGLQSASSPVAKRTGRPREPWWRGGSHPLRVIPAKAGTQLAAGTSGSIGPGSSPEHPVSSERRCRMWHTPVANSPIPPVACTPSGQTYPRCFQPAYTPPHPFPTRTDVDMRTTWGMDRQARGVSLLRGTERQDAGDIAGHRSFIQKSCRPRGACVSYTNPSGRTRLAVSVLPPHPEAHDRWLKTLVRPRPAERPASRSLGRTAGACQKPSSPKQLDNPALTCYLLARPELRSENA